MWLIDFGQATVIEHGCGEEYRCSSGVKRGWRCTLDENQKWSTSQCFVADGLSLQFRPTSWFVMVTICIHGRSRTVLWLGGEHRMAHLPRRRTS